MLKDSFKFTVVDKDDIVYTASKLVDCYRITWEWDGLRNTTAYRDNIVESNVLAGRWKVIEEGETKPKRSISVNINSAYAAAKWEFENNKLSHKPERSLQEILDKINDFIEEIYEQAMQQKEFEYLFCGTGGSWTVQFQPESEDYGTVEVVTDVSTGMPIHYIDVEEYLQQG